MPAITRSQRKAMQASQVSNPVVNIDEVNRYKKNEFIRKCKQLLSDCQKAFGKENKAKICIKLYDIINNELPELFEKDKYEWIHFVASTYNKILDIERELNESNFIISVDILDTLSTKLFQAKNFTSEMLKKHSDLRIHPQIEKAMKNLKKTEPTRPRRNIKRVDYTGMDMNEDDKGEVSVFKRWFENGKITYKVKKYPLSQVNEIGDEDYVAEETDDEYEDEDEEKKAKNTKCSKLSPSEKQEIKEEINQISNYNAKLRCKIVPNYSGMDMNEDDHGEFKISKKMMDDGELIHYWVSVPLSQINDYDDEDYIDEEL